MASIRKTGATYTVCFRFRERQYQRALKTGDRSLAETLLAEISGRLGRLARGEKPLPDNVNPVEYILTGREQPVAPAPDPVAPITPPTIAEAVEQYRVERQAQLAATTVVTERIHLQNIVSSLEEIAPGAKSLPLPDVDPQLLRRALLARSAVVSTTTVSKERQTLRGLLNWLTTDLKHTNFAELVLPKFPKRTRGDRFMTVEEIESTLSRGELDEEQISELWSRLYLLPNEIADVLDLVRQRSTDAVEVLLHSLVAYTGIRRGEAQRLRWTDIDLVRNRVTVRSRKQSRSEEETWREIDLHADLAALLAENRDCRRSGQFVLSKAGSLDSLTVDEINYHFRRPLRETRWEKTVGEGKKRVVVRPHVMRHSFASCLAARGVDQRIIDRMMGHVTPAMARHYQHLAPAVRRSAIEQLTYGTTSSSLGKIDDAA